MAVNNQIEELLKPIGLPVAYRMFKPYKNKPVPNPPYIVYLIDNENAHGADSKNFILKKHITIEFYSNKKDTETEGLIEAALSAVEYEKYEDYIDTEKLFEVSYEFDIYEKIRRKQ